MPSARQGSIRLFRFAGIDLFLHLSWFLVAAYEISGRTRRYSSLTWNVAEYLALFSIVMLHEFGHALACRQVGGTANEIVLWPLGGVAYVHPPPRPGATLWSIAADDLAHQPLVADFQYVANLPAGWRSDPSVPAVVCDRTRPQSDGSHDPWLPGRGRVHHFGSADAFRMVWSSLGLHAHELLERTATCASLVALAEVAASRWICMSEVQNSTPSRELLEVWAVPTAI